VKRYEYINGVDGNYVMPVEVHPTLNFPDILYLDREGIGIRLGNAFSTESMTCDVYSFTRISPRGLKGDSFTAGSFFPSTTTVSGSNYIRKYTLYGGAPTSTSNSYIFMFKGIMARYDPVPGNSISDVVIGLKNSINGTDFGDYSISAASSLSILTVTIDSPQLPGMYNAYNNLLQFESGLYTKVSILGDESEYLIERNESNYDFPAIPSVASSYDFVSLINVGNVENYIKLYHSPLYTITYNSYYTKTGTTSITGIPFMVPTSSSAVYDQSNSRIVFSNQSPLKPKEVATLVYR